MRPRDVTKQRELLIPNNDKALLAHLIQGSGEQPEQTALRGRFAGGEHTKGLDTGKGLVRTFIYMNNTTTPNMSFHHLTSTFATTAGRLVAPMRSLVTKFLAVTAIFVVAGTTVFAPSAFASSSSDDGVLLVTGDWGLNDLELPMLHKGEKFDENVQVQLATNPGTETTVDLTLSNQFKNDDVNRPKIELDKIQLIFTSGNWDTPQNVLVDHLEGGWKEDPAFITLTVNGSETTITLIHVHDDDPEWPGIVAAREARAAEELAAEELAAELARLAGDPDGDGITTGEEEVPGVDGFVTLADNADTDGDNLADNDEISNGTDPTKADTDGDGENDDVDPAPNNSDDNTATRAADQAAADQAAADQAAADQAAADQAAAQAAAAQAAADQAAADQAAAQAAADQAAADQAAAQAAADQAAADQAAAQAAADQAAADQAAAELAADQVAADQAAADQAAEEATPFQAAPVEPVEEIVVEELVEETDDDTVLIQVAPQTLNGGEGPSNGTNPEANNTSPGTSGSGTDGNSRTSSNLNNDGTVESGFSEGARSPLSSSTLATAAGIAAAAGLGLSGVGARLGTALLRFLSSTGVGLFLIGLFRRDRRPGAPENFMIFSSGQITNLVWTAPTAGKAPERYIVEGSVNGYWREVFEFGTNVCRAGVPTSEVQGICDWRLRAANEHGVGKPSNEALLEAGTAEATTDLPMAA